jgi:cytosine deaminase
MTTLLIKDAHIKGGRSDMLIQDGYITALAPNLDATADETVDAKGQLVLPAFVESHIHLDKAFVADRSPGLSNDGPSPQKLLAELKREFTVDDVYTRARRALEQAVRHGCLAMRAYVEIDPFVEMRGVEAMLRLKADFRDVVDLQLVAFAQEGIYQDDVTQELLIEGLEQGLEVLGGCPYMDPGREREHIDWFFEVAQRHGVPLDFHADSADDPALLTSDYIAQQVRAYSMQGQVQIGHLCLLDVLEPDARARVIEALCESEIHVVSLPATESHVKGRPDTKRVWRGVTRISELRSAGVNVAVATNNVVNPFTPFGHADLLRQLLITAITAHLGNLDDLAWLPELVTDNPAQALGLADYGLHPGARADFVIIDAPDAVTAIIEQSEKTLVYKAGRVVASNERRNALHLCA